MVSRGLLTPCLPQHPALLLYSVPPPPPPPPQGDPKAAIPAWCEAEGIELVLLGTRSGGNLRKKLSGGSVSGHLIDHCPCPCLVVPYSYLGLEEASRLHCRSG